MIKWSITEVKSDATTGGVIAVCVAHEGQNGDKADHRWNWVNFYPDTSAAGFVPFNQLSEEMVLNWVFAKLGAEWKARKEHDLNEHLGLATEPVISTEIPWAA